MIRVIFYNLLIFDTPRLHNLLARTEMFRVHGRAIADFQEHAVELVLESLSLELTIICSKSEGQLSAQLCHSSLPTFSNLELESLQIREDEPLGLHRRLWARQHHRRLSMAGWNLYSHSPL